MLRVLHFSDIHVQIPVSELPRRDLASPKRVLGALNFKLKREAHFENVHQKLARLKEHADACDLVLCTGDFTALGTDPELARAREEFQQFLGAKHGAVIVPGNHDVYVESATTERRFEKHFGELLTSDMPEYCVDGTWPIVRLIGDDVAVVAVNSARPNPQLWRSSGEIPSEQLSAMERITADPRVHGRFIFVMTHYAPFRRDGTPDVPWHGLTNVKDFLRALQGVRFGAMLHGHIHWRYQLHVSGLPARIFGAGSVTHEGREGFWIYEIDGEKNSRAIPGSWAGDRYVLNNEAAVAI